MEMKIFDILLKDAVARAAVEFPKASTSVISGSLQARSDYCLRVLAADRATQIAVRNAAQLDTSNTFAQFISDVLDVWLSPECSGILPTTRLLAPVTLPSDTIAVIDTRDFPRTGSLRINAINFSQIISYTGKEQGQNSGTFTGCTQEGGYTGNTGVGTASLNKEPDLDISPSACKERRDTFIAAFTRRSQNTIGALGYINEEHIWEDPRR